MTKIDNNNLQMNKISIAGKVIKEINQFTKIYEGKDLKGRLYFVKTIQNNLAEKYGISQTIDYNRQVLSDIDQFSFPDQFLKIVSELSIPEVISFVTDPFECTLEQYLTKKQINQKEALQIFQQVLKSFYSLYKVGYWHKNIRAQHFVKVGKFWKLQSLVFTEDFSKSNGNKNAYLWDSQFQAPEFYAGDKQFTEDDYELMFVWNLGALLVNLLVGANVLSNQKILKAFQNETFSFQKINIQKKIQISEELQNILQKMLHYNPVKRIRLVELFRLKFFSKDVSNISKELRTSLFSERQLKYLTYMPQIHFKGEKQVYGIFKEDPKIEHFEKITTDFYIDRSTKLGKGNHGTVFKGYQLSTKLQIAIKQISLKFIETSAGKDYWEVEIHELITQNSHPNVIKFLGYEKNEKGLFIFFELYHENLKERLARQSIDQKSVLNYIKQIVSAMSHLNKLKIIHRDLKPTKILFDKNKQLKLSGFTLARIVSLQMEKGACTPLYGAPEVLKLQSYSQTCDVWSAGLVLFEMLTRKQLFANVKNKQQLFNEQDKFKSNLHLMKYPSDIHQFWKQITLKMLTYDKQSRPTFEEMNNKSFFTPKLRQPGVGKIKYVDQVDRMMIKEQSYPFNEDPKDHKAQISPTVKKSINSIKQLTKTDKIVVPDQKYETIVRSYESQKLISQSLQKEINRYVETAKIQHQKHISLVNSYEKQRQLTKSLQNQINRYAETVQQLNKKINQISKVVPKKLLQFEVFQKKIQNYEYLVNSLNEELRKVTNQSVRKAEQTSKQLIDNISSLIYNLSINKNGVFKTFQPIIKEFQSKIMSLEEQNRQIQKQLVEKTRNFEFRLMNFNTSIVVKEQIEKLNSYLLKARYQDRKIKEKEGKLGDKKKI